MQSFMKRKASCQVGKEKPILSHSAQEKELNPFEEAEERRLQGLFPFEKRVYILEVFMKFWETLYIVTSIYIAKPLF